MTHYLTGAALAILALAQSAAAQPAPDAPPAGTLKLDRVVLLMRHGVRPSTKFPATPAGTTRDPWPAWSTAAGDLTPHGAEAIRRLGAYDRMLFTQQGLLPASGCAAPGTVVAWASSASRAIKTGKAFLETLQPGCAVPLDHPVNEDDDAVFHPLDGSMEIDGQKALAAAQALLPPAASPKRWHATPMRSPCWSASSAVARGTRAGRRPQSTSRSAPAIVKPGCWQSRATSPIWTARSASPPPPARPSCSSIWRGCRCAPSAGTCVQARHPDDAAFPPDQVPL